jgi:SAM-dependent MidA family methyltransferase
MEPSPLEAEIRRRIAQGGPMPVRQYMRLCLFHPKHGYYMTRDPLGRAGDFVTAPEISQMFGELIGLWAASVWRLMGEPENVRLVELGPGRGTLMRDALRAAHVVPKFRSAIVAHLVEISPELERRQRHMLGGLDVPVRWHQNFDEVPAGPLIVIANEFFDALPVQQAVRHLNGWYERVVIIDEAGDLAYGTANEPLPLFDKLLPPAIRDAPMGTLYEWRPDNLILEISRRLVHENGAALIIDYGHAESAPGETFQAVAGHDFADPLVAPGTADLTAHVDFQALAAAAETMGAQVSGPIEQGRFLHALGLIQRAAALKEKATRQQALDIDLTVARLTGEGRTAMGTLFKVLGVAHPKLGALPGFEAET